MSEKTSVTEMTYDEFVRWAHEYVTEGLLTGGLRGMRENIHTIVQQQALVFRHGGFRQKDSK